MPDVEELCERVLLINDGQTLLYGRLAELRQARGMRSVRVTADRQPESMLGVVDTKFQNGSFEYLMGEGTKPDEILRAYLDASIPVERYEIALPSLNQIFIEEVSRARNAE
jgi:ABC-2 type transport system ATP-binding protein